MIPISIPLQVNIDQTSISDHLIKRTSGDKIKAPIRPVNNQSKVLPLPTSTQQVASVQTPPLPETPSVNPQLAASNNPVIDPTTGLTDTQEQLYSPTEKLMAKRMNRSKGMA